MTKIENTTFSIHFSTNKFNAFEKKKNKKIINELKNDPLLEMPHLVVRMFLYVPCIPVLTFPFQYAFEPPIMNWLYSSYKKISLRG